MNIAISSTKNKQAIDITEEVNKIISERKVEKGLALIFVKHTTAALAIGEVGEGTDEDLLEVVQKMIPEIKFRHGHNPSHTPDHMIGSLVGPSVVVPIWGGSLDLGTWQRIILLELNGPREINFSLTISKN